MIGPTAADVAEMSAWYLEEDKRTLEDVGFEFGWPTSTVGRYFRLFDMPAKAPGQRPGKPHTHNVARKGPERKPYLDPTARIARPNLARNFR